MLSKLVYHLVSPKLRQKLLELPRHKKRALLVLLDFVTLSSVLWLAMSIRFDEVYWPDNLTTAGLLFAAPVLTIIAFAYSGLYRLVTRYLGTRGNVRIVMAAVLAMMVWAVAVHMIAQYAIPRSVIIIYGVVSAVAAMLTRHAIAWVLKASGAGPGRFDTTRERHGVIIYGAGPAGIELASALTRLPGRDVVGFCDVSPTLWGQYVSGIKVYRPEKLPRIIERFKVKEILLAIPSSDRQLRRELVKELEHHPVAVNIMPSLDDIAAGLVSVTDLRPLDVADLLGRDSVPPISDLMSRNTRGKSVLVTGAGGSVGSELVRQLLRQKPARLILFDLSEAALFEIEMEAREFVADLTEQAPEIVAVLGSVLDPQLVSETMNRFTIETVYHAAAYKHVPMVERNPGVGLTNNIFGTEVVAEAAIANGVERVVLISTDKAVRPKNVMGASKRMAELVLQARASQSPATVFTMVRFGNVLDSSGSVVGRFRRQIKSGGQVTVTHPEVIRYFMSIPEAAELVIQAGAMAKGGEVFVLDMGEPVKIIDLARLMVRLSGFEVRDESHPHGDIEIAFTGLRPGEKLYEELLIGGGATSSTEHPRILRSDEPFLAPPDLKRELDLLRAAISIRDIDNIQAVLMRAVEGYEPDSDFWAQENAPALPWALPSRTLH